MHIATLAPTQDGYGGRIRTLTIDAAIVLVPSYSDAENAPAFRVHLDDADGPEIGAAWKHTGPKAGDYLSLELDDPAFGFQPLRANLFRTNDDGSEFVLTWNRPARQGERS